MEKWAKSMNAQKEALKDGMKKINLPNLSGRKESATADAGFAILEKAVSRHVHHLICFRNFNKTHLFYLIGKPLLPSIQQNK